ncbi:NYN domain-containing protein [Flagelloscypha sp. PMI_526]|nr:NYN domain-containing protein [Flagelloscypha sp. PMI_526]
MSAHEVAVFWDFENCAPPNHHSGVEIVNLLRDVLLDRGQIYQFRAYMSLSETTPSARTIALRSELQLSGVSLIDVPHIGRKNAVDLMMIVDMMTFCMDHKRHSTIVLLTGDCDFAYPISTIRHRGFQVILISPRGENTHPSLRLQVNEYFLGKTSCPNQPVGPAALESLKCPSAHKCSNSELGPPTTSLLSPLSAGTPSQFEPSVVVTASSVVQSQVDLPEQPEAQTPPDSVAIIDELEQSRTLSDYQDTSISTFYNPLPRTSIKTKNPLNIQTSTSLPLQFKFSRRRWFVSRRYLLDLAFLLAFHLLSGLCL